MFYVFSYSQENQPLKDINTPTARLYNWNLLTEKLKRIGIDLDSDIKSLIVGGDLEMISEIVKDIFERSNQLQNSAIYPKF